MFSSFFPHATWRHDLASVVAVMGTLHSMFSHRNDRIRSCGLAWFDWGGDGSRVPGLIGGFDRFRTSDTSSSRDMPLRLPSPTVLPCLSAALRLGGIFRKTLFGLSKLWAEMSDIAVGLTVDSFFIYLCSICRRDRPHATRAMGLACRPALF